ncbi:TonB-dependent siderophore receptor [Zhouia sp. PK063]|uniref:TonB-dependent siderophore receptor n=1 Tax=Zhouia sp. PK063 TaxID=3373602 RepID=UPI003790535E
MIKRLLSLMLLCFLGTHVWSQNTTTILTGTIVNKEHEPLNGVNVVLKGTNYGASTNATGTFVINNIPEGNYILVISTIGYKTKQQSVTLHQKKQTINVSLEEDISMLNDVTISGKKSESYAKETVSSSLRLNEDLSKIPQNVQVVSGELLKDQQVFSIMDAITKNVSGAQMIEHWGWFARINMRGFRLPAFRNGMNVEMTWGPLAEDLSMVDRVEFVKGPAGFMMAAGQPGGFYNVVTKKPIKDTFANVSFATGSYNTYRGTIDVGSYAANGKLQFRLNVMTETADSHREYDNSSRFSVVPSIKYNITDNTSITTEFTLQKAKMKAGSAYVFAPASAGFGSLGRNFSAIDPAYPDMNVDEYNTFTNITHKLNDQWSVQAQYMYMNYNQEGATQWPASIADNGDLVRSVTSADALGTYNIAQLFVSGNFYTGTIEHKILAGFDFNEKRFWADWNQGGIIDTDHPFNIFNPTYGDVTMPVFDRAEDIKTRGASNGMGQTTRGYYVQDELSFLQDQLRVTLAGRYTVADMYSYGVPADANKFTPRFGVSYDVFPSLTVYGLYDESFYPQQGVKYINENTTAPLSPEDANDIEGGIKKSWFNNRLKTSLTIYKIKKKHMSTADYTNGVPTDDGGVSYPYSIEIGEVESKGIEFDMQGQITPELNVILNYANTDVEDNYGNKVAGFAKHITNGWLNYAFNSSSKLHGFGASVGYQYQVDRSSWNWGADNKSDLPDYFRMDGGVFWKYKTFDVRLNVNNLLNKYLYSGANYGTYVYWQAEPGRNFRLSLSYKF